ncbi:MAG: ROK family protein [Longimicrobiales bacterium]|nr:ROK family protein [Longimicrobiales bacterium]
MAEDFRWIVGLDIGGTNMVVGLVPLEGGAAVGVRKLLTRSAAGGEDVVRRAVEAVEGSMEEVFRTEGGGRSQVAGIGIGAPGPLNRKTGVLLEAPNLGWRNFPLRSLVSDGLGLPAEVDNDANCATYGEWWMGAGRGSTVLVGLTLGTGIGGGLVINGELHHGVSDAASEFGHTTIDSTGRKCKCGNYGCLEAYASGPNIAARAVEGIEYGAESVLVELVDGDLEKITAATVYEGVVLGDPYAHDVMKETAKLLGVGVANLINALNPDVVVIAGGVTRAGDHLFIPLRKEVRRRAFRSAVDACRIVPAALPETAGVVGAAGIFKKATFGHI